LRSNLLQKAVAGSVLIPFACLIASGGGSVRRADIVRHMVVYESAGYYCAWPSIARVQGNEIVVVFTRTEEHLGPDGAIMLTRSSEGGTTWTTPNVIRDTPIDDRESGLTVLREGKLLAHFWSTRHTAESYARLAPLSYEKEAIDRWTARVRTSAYTGAAAFEGAWHSFSGDGGRTWSAPVRGIDAVHGGIQLHDGGMLVTSYRLHPDSIVVYRADSPGGAWRKLAVLLSPDPVRISFCEPHVLQLPSGRVLMMIRAVTHPYDDTDPRCVLWETWSDDEGRTWNDPRPTPLWGYPPHMLLLADGRVLVTYGYRRPPYGERVCLSSDGVTWRQEDELILRDDARNGDLGYPASVELQPGTVLTVYYQPDVPPGTIQRMQPPDPARKKPGIMGTVWHVPPRR